MIAVPAVLGPTCSVRCSDHREHVYVVCYGQPTQVRDRDYLVGERVFDYPISHYVGHTRGAPLRRLWTHGHGSSQKVAAVVPGDQRREQVIKELEACPTCGRSLWYYGESPRPLNVLQGGDVATRGPRGRIRYLVVDGARDELIFRRLDPGGAEWLTASESRRIRVSLVPRWRDPASYVALQQKRQRGLASVPVLSGVALERRRVEAYHALSRTGRPSALS